MVDVAARGLPGIVHKRLADTGCLDVRYFGLSCLTRNRVRWHGWVDHRALYMEILCPVTASRTEEMKTSVVKSHSIQLEGVG